MTEPVDLEAADVQFGTLRIKGMRRVVCAVIFDSGEADIGMGVDTKSALEDAIRRALPNIKEIASTGHAAWHPLMKPGMMPDEVERLVHAEPADEDES